MKGGQLSTLTKTCTLDSISCPPPTYSETLGKVFKLLIINFLICKMGTLLVTTCGCYKASMKMLVKLLEQCLIHSTQLILALFTHSFLPSSSIYLPKNLSLPLGTIETNIVSNNYVFVPGRSLLQTELLNKQNSFSKRPPSIHFCIDNFYHL